MVDGISVVDDRTETQQKKKIQAQRYREAQAQEEEEKEGVAHCSAIIASIQV